MATVEIPLSKLFQWLAARGLLPFDWGEIDESVRQQIAELNLLEQCRDIPMDPNVLDLIRNNAGSFLEYQSLMNNFLENPALKQKNFFGQYKTEFVDRFNSILGNWTKKNAHIGSIACSLVQELKYEIPNVKKQIVALEKQYANCGKRILECEKNMQNTDNNYKTACADWGIDGSSRHMLPYELQQLLSTLPSLLADIRHTLKMTSFQPCWDYYLAFTSFTRASQLTTTDQDGDFSKPLCDKLQLIQTIRQGSDAGVHRHTTLDTMMDGNAPGDPLSNTNPNIIVMKELCDQRVDLMNELSELNAFFEMRLFELNSTEEELAFSSTDFIREAKKKFPVLAIGLTDVKRLKHTVSEIIDSLYDKRLVRICAMGADPDGLKRAEQSLLSYSGRINRIRREIQNTEERTLEIQMTLGELNKRLRELDQHAQMLRTELERLISEGMSNSSSISVSILID